MRVCVKLTLPHLVAKDQSWHAAMSIGCKGCRQAQQVEEVRTRKGDLSFSLPMRSRPYLPLSDLVKRKAVEELLPPLLPNLILRGRDRRDRVVGVMCVANEHQIPRIAVLRKMQD